jgi:hypothetical protein
VAPDLARLAPASLHPIAAMNPGRLSQIEQLYRADQNCNPVQRLAFLNQASGGDDEFCRP